MELREPKRKRRCRQEPKSSLPLVFGSKGELTKFHANLTALGSCIADPMEMEIIHKMGYFGKGSLSKSHPIFGRIRYGAPPIIRKRQWQRRQEWISEVQKLSIESYFDDDKNEDRNENAEAKETDAKDFNNTAETLNSTCESNAEAEETDAKDFNNTTETLNSTCESNASAAESHTSQEKLTNDIEILDDVNNQSNGQNHATSMEVDEVLLDSTEEEDICETSAASYHSNNFAKGNLFYKDDEIHINSEFNKDNSDLQGKVLVLPDSDSDTENFLIDIKPKIKHESFPVRETLHLTFEETFFLMYGLGCLRVIDFDGKYLSIGETWAFFCKEHKYFLQKYVTYHYFRSKGWVVKPGLKYGGDYLLYKEGLPYYHSSYIVIIDILDAVTFKRIESKTVRSMTWNKFIGLQRLAESVGKEVLFAQVLWPSSVPIDSIPTSPEVLSQFTVKEVLWRRWKLSHDTFSSNNEADYDDEEDDYSL